MSPLWDASIRDDCILNENSGSANIGSAHALIACLPSRIGIPGYNADASSAKWAKYFPASLSARSFRYAASTSRTALISASRVSDGGASAGGVAQPANNIAKDAHTMTPG